MDWSYLSIFWHKYQNKPSSTVQDCHSTARFVLFRFVCWFARIMQMNFNNQLLITYLTLNANGVPDGNPVMSHLVVACTTDKEVHPDGVPEPPTFVSTNQLLKTHPIPKALAFQVNVSQTGAGRSWTQYQWRDSWSCTDWSCTNSCTNTAGRTIYSRIIATHSNIVRIRGTYRQ